MTSSPAPDLEPRTEAGRLSVPSERLLAILKEKWPERGRRQMRAVVESWLPEIELTVREEAEAAAESGRLREALERLPRWSIRWNDNDEGTIEVVSLRRVLALLATPPAPSDQKPTRDPYARLAAAHEAEPTVPDRGGGVPGDRFPLPPAPSDHGALDVDRLAQALHEYEHSDHLASTGCRTGHRAKARALAALLAAPSVSPKEGT